MSGRLDKPIIMLPGLVPGDSRTQAGPERRLTFRFPFTAAAEVTEVRSQARVVGRSSDLGSGGCYIDALSPFSVGALVRVRLERDLHVFEATAVVTYAHVSMGMGLAFTDIQLEYQAVLRTWIAGLSGEQPPEPEVTAAGPETGMLAAIVNLRQVLNELINLMVRKKIITENEGAGLLRQMFR